MAAANISNNCSICRGIWRRFADPDSSHAIQLGPFKDAIATECSKHKPLVERFIEYCRSDSSDGRLPTREPDSTGITAGSKGSSVQLIEDVSRGGLFWDLLLVRRDSVPNHPGTGRILDANWVDLDVIKQWKNECLSLHGRRCENPMKIRPIQPAWLIDVKNKCVVPGQDCGPFVALSYRVGKDSGLRINVDTLAKVQKPNSLDNPDIAASLSPVLRHAMYLTSVIGERYLWVDMLCIVAGDRETTDEQINLMSAIYASALLTIIAADGDAQDGLLGLEGASPPRRLEQRLIPFEEETLTARNTEIFSLEHGGTAYYSRGWTYQELKMSKRRIFFVNKEVHWQCQCSVWHEDLILGAEVDKYIDPRLGVILAGFPDIDSLSHAIGNYNRQDLTYDEDALSSISGLLSVLSRSFTGGFLYGLPEMLFDRALAWKPYWGHTDLRRRAPSDPTRDSQSSLRALPSWSWIGWQGLVAMGDHDAVRINDRQYWIEETIPITKWYTSSSPTDSRPRRITSSWFENRDAFKDISKPLPSGWTRHKAPTDDSSKSEIRLYPDGCDTYTFKHHGMPDEDCDSWYYPFPVARIEESTPMFTPEQTPFIFCETERAQVWAHQAGKDDELDRNKLTLSSESSHEIGFLHLHNQEQLALFPKATADDALGRPVDIVAICRSRRYSKTWDEKEQRYTQPTQVKDAYEVLWVEWKDRIAYRLAIGKIWKEEWDNLALEQVSLTLA